MNSSDITDIIVNINNELSKNSKTLSVKVVCYIETKNHLYHGYYNSVNDNTILLTNSFLKESADNFIRLDETRIQLDKDDIVAFSYKVISENKLN